MTVTLSLPNWKPKLAPTVKKNIRTVVSNTRLGVWKTFEHKSSSLNLARSDDSISTTWVQHFLPTRYCANQARIAIINRRPENFVTALFRAVSFSVSSSDQHWQRNTTNCRTPWSSARVKKVLPTKHKITERVAIRKKQFYSPTCSNDKQGIMLFVDEVHAADFARLRILVVQVGSSLSRLPLVHAGQGRIINIARGGERQRHSTFCTWRPRLRTSFLSHSPTAVPPLSSHKENESLCEITHSNFEQSAETICLFAVLQRLWQCGDGSWRNIGEAKRSNT